MLETLGSIGLVDVADILIVSLLLFSVILLVRRTRARTALVGLAILGVIYLVSGQLGLRVTAWILQGFFAVLVIVLVVIFQEDLRRFFEQIASLGLGSLRGRTPVGITDVVVRSVAELARHSTGALLVFPGREGIERHVDGGIALGGSVSEPLVLSLFDASSPGHDGAVVIRNGVVERFAVHLPLSSDHQQLGPGGTRHAAALGLAERTDALCVVVSEERATVSVAQNSELRVLSSPGDLAWPLRSFLHEEVVPAKRTPALWLRLREAWREAAVSLLLALVVWVFFVPGSAPIQVTQSVPVLIENLPDGFVLEAVEPPEVDVVLSGRRRQMLLLDRGALEVRIDGLLAQLGRRTFQLEDARIDVPPSVEVVRMTPDRVRISVSRPKGRQGAEAAEAP